jgi:tRNA1(Val) A37 N6-methylase TrmN6
MIDETTDDAVLGGRLRLLQPRRGHRIGHDAILLAAATGAKPGEHVIEFGAGVGAAGLAIALREPRLTVSLLEMDAELCALAADNAARNGVADRVCVLAANVETLKPATLAIANRVLMNPPFNDPRRHNVSPDPKRRTAHIAEPNLLPRWIAQAASVLRDGGVLTLIWRAEALDIVLYALAPDFGDIAILPVYPRPDAAPIRVLVRAVKGAAWAHADCKGLVLNDAAGKPTQAAEAILREGRTLALAGLG